VIFDQLVDQNPELQQEWAEPEWEIDLVSEQADYGNYPGFRLLYQPKEVK